MKLLTGGARHRMDGIWLRQGTATNQRLIFRQVRRATLLLEGPMLGLRSQGS